MQENQQTNKKLNIIFFSKSERKTSIIIFLFGILFLTFLRWFFKQYAFDGIYFQEWSSEDMMQTVSIIDLRIQPWKSLLYLHIQPPLLDSLRLLLVHLFRTDNFFHLLRQVDFSLYNIWTLVYGLSGVIIFNWIYQLTSHQRIAIVASLVFFLHPATIFYATFLEGTFLTSFGILWLMFSIWILTTRKSIWPLITGFIFLFSLRSIFQWPALIILTISLLLLGINKRKIIIFIVISSLFLAPYMIKQYLLFGTISTSSFFGSSCFHSLGVFPNMGVSKISLNEISLGPLFPYESIEDLPNVLTRTEKLTGIHNFNNLADLENEKQLLSTCTKKITTQPFKDTILSYIHNIVVFFQPSSAYYTAHKIVDHLPWRGLYDFIFSGFPLFFLLIFSGVWWLLNHTKQDLRIAFAFLLPVLYVFLSCVLFEKIENMRYKFFIEPVLFVFIFTQMYSFITKYAIPKTGNIIRKQ